MENSPIITGMAVADDSANVGKIPMDRMNLYFARILSRISGLSIKSLEMRDGQMYFDGAIPEKIYKAVG